MGEGASPTGTQVNWRQPAVRKAMKTMAANMRFTIPVPYIRRFVPHIDKRLSIQMGSRRRGFRFQVSAPALAG